MIKDVIIRKITSNDDNRGFFREIMKVTDTYTNVKFKQISHSKVHKSIKVYLLDLRKKSKTYREQNKFIVNEKEPLIYFFPPHVAHGYVALGKDNHIIYGTSGVFSKLEEYKLPF
jgi:dTDP-4-dehydrorhamnose 3,5-epimerase-like enzyme